MNRRSFLARLFGAAACVAVPIQAPVQPIALVPNITKGIGAMRVNPSAIREIITANALRDLQAELDYEYIVTGHLLS